MSKFTPKVYIKKGVSKKTGNDYEVVVIEIAKEIHKYVWDFSEAEKAILKQGNVENLE